MAKRGKLGEDDMEEFSEDFADLSDLFDTSLPDPYRVEYYRRLKNRELFLNGDIDDQEIDFTFYIRKWNLEDRGLPVEERKPIRIFINTDGGVVDVVFHIADMISLSKTPVHTIGMGRVYSAGVPLLIAGHRRFIFPHTSCLIHDGSSGAIGSIGKLLDNLEFTKDMELKMKEYVLSRTNIPEELYDQNYRRDWYLFSDEMIRLGIADEIITDISSIL